MSRIGKKAIEIPDRVQIRQDQAVITVEGPKGTLSRTLPAGLEVKVEGRQVTVGKLAETRTSDAYQGLARTLIANMVTGVSAGFVKSLEVVGVGYRAEIAGDQLKLMVGFSDAVTYRVPEGINVQVDKQVNISVSGIDRELVGRVAAEIRGIRKPEPYKGKGIKYVGEHVRRKVGKSVGA
jgi:large subunit ribosomal protein L6